MRGDLAAELVTGADGTAVSEPLETGWYLLRETKAPDTYAIMQRDTRVQITSNHTEALQIENAQRGALQIIKYGQLTLGAVATESRFPWRARCSAYILIRTAKHWRRTPTATTPG